MLISICVCTYNRAAILERCLGSLASLRPPEPPHEVEVIIIDNNSNDKTSAVAERHISTAAIEMKYIFESEQGLSAARNRAVLEANGDYIAFLDDECIMGADWLSSAITDIDEFHPCVIGGPYVGAFLPGHRPGWFKIEYGNAYFLTCNYERGFQHQFRASGGNMMVRRDVFDHVRFDTKLGMIANKLKLGEEVDLQERFILAHPTERVFYEPRMLVEHFILPNKMTLLYYASRLFESGFNAPETVKFKVMLYGLVRTAYYALVGPIRCIFRDRNKYPFWQNYFYERIIPPICLSAGYLKKYLRADWQDQK